MTFDFFNNNNNKLVPRKKYKELINDIVFLNFNIILIYII